MSWREKNVEFDTLIGQTLVNVERKGDEELLFTLSDGRRLRMHHDQDCCEQVTIEDIAGDLADLIGTPLTMAEEAISDKVNPEGVPVPKYQDSFTWTFYKFATVKGYVTIRWYGESNGYYSESVDLTEVGTDRYAQ